MATGKWPNQPQTLTGIETEYATRALTGTQAGPINLKPLQGLKPHRDESTHP